MATNDKNETNAVCLAKDIKDMENRRNSSIELLRIIAMILIMQYHYVIHGGISVGLDNLGKNAFVAKMMCMGGKIGVNIFVIISCWFFVESSITYARIQKKIKAVYIPVWIYSVSIYFFKMVIGRETFSIENFVKAIFPFSFSSNWYASAYIIFLASLPCLKIIIDNISEKEHKFICILSVVCWIILPTVQGTIIINALNHASNILWFSVCYILVAYIRKYMDYKDKKVVLCGILVAMLSYVYFAIGVYLADYHNIFLTLSKVDYSTYLMQINYVPVVACSFALFFVFVNLYFSSKIINRIADLVFGVYLIHDNDHINNLIWGRFCKSGVAFDGEFFYLKAISGIIIVFLVCGIIEATRKFISKTIIVENVAQ